MDKKTDNQKTAPQQNQNADPQHIQEAHQQADKDIAQDADLSIHSPNDDLDEGELANLGGDKNDLV